MEPAPEGSTPPLPEKPKRRPGRPRKNPVDLNKIAAPPPSVRSKTKTETESGPPESAKERDARVARESMEAVHRLWRESAVFGAVLLGLASIAGACLFIIL